MITKCVIFEANNLQVKSEIARRLEASTRALQDLGTKRQTPAEQMHYLIGMSTDFQNLVREALATDYGHHKMFMDNPSLRLVTAAVNRSVDMAKMFDKHGHTYRFGGHSANDTEAAEDTGSDIDVDSGDEDQPRFPSKSVTVTPVDHPLTSPVRQYLEPTAINHLIPNTSEVEKPRPRKIFDWLRRIHRDSRGYEIGTVNPTLLATVMKEQARKWNDIALGYIGDTIVLTHTFINDLLHEVCPTRRVREGIMSLLMEELCTRYQKAINYVKFLLAVDLDGKPSTLNHYFNDNLQKRYVRLAYRVSHANCNFSRQKRLRRRIESKTVNAGDYGEVVSTSDLFSLQNMGNDEHTIQELHDILHSYYKVARKRFVDNVRQHAGDHFLLSGPETPLTLFNPTFVIGLSDKQLEEAVGEDRQLKRQRAILEKTVEELKDAMNIIR